MKALVQRVSRAQVTVADSCVGAIGPGLLVFLAVVRGDGPAQMERMIKKVAGLRIFSDEAGRMNLAVGDIGGSLLVISQFTLAADLKKGFRPSFANAEEPAAASAMYDLFCETLAATGLPVERGVFGADMQVELVNDGPVTLWLDFPPKP